MNVQVRIITAQAQQRIKALEGDIRRLNMAMSSGAGGARQMEGGFARAMTAGTKFGNQLQWTGRQLQYNFAMPIALAAGMATKFALDNEAAMVRVKKVYGDAGQDVEDFGGEVAALERNFRALSNHFGVNRAEVIKVAGDWAAAGATGVALAKATKLTLETMVLGEMEAAEATEALLSVQGQYNLSVQELSQSMDTLNMIENETDVSMKQLITSMARSAGTARQAGVDVQHLAAMTAALVPEAGAAGNAGNGLKTIISRMLSPTEDAAAVLGKMGLSMEDLDWQSLNVTQRLQALADEFVKLPEGQRAVVGEYVAGRYQITRFNQALTDIADRNGDYHKAVNASADATLNYRQRVRELNAVLSSNPQKMKQVSVILQNAAADVIIPLIPALVFLAQKIAQMAQAFANLDPSIQMIVGSVLLFLMLFGPLLRYLGSTITLFATIGDGAKFAAGPLVNLARRLLFLGPAAAAGQAGATSAMAAGVATQSALATGHAGRLSRLWAGFKGWFVRTTVAQWAAANAAQAAGQAASRAQQNRLNIFTINSTTGTTGRLTGMWRSFWANQNRTQAAAQGASTTATRAWTARAHGYYAQQTAMATAANTQTSRSTVVAATTQAGAWNSMFGRVTVSHAQFVEGYIVGDVALRETSLVTTRMMYANWVSYWTALTAGQRSLGAGQFQIASASSSAEIAVRRNMMLILMALYQQYMASVLAMYRGLGTGMLAITSATTGKEVAIRQTGLETMTVLQAEFFAQQKAAYALNRGWMSAEEAGWTVVMSEITAGRQATLLAIESGGYAQRAGGAAAFHGTIIEGEVIAGASQNAARARALGAGAAQEAAAQGAQRGRWAAVWGWLTAGHQTWALRMGAIGQIGFGRMAAVESAALTASRARWTAYWMTVSTMQRGAAARMVATDAAMKAKLASGKFMRLLLSPWSLAFLAIIGLAYVFRDDIVRIFGQVREWIGEQMRPLAQFFSNLGNRIVEAFYALPKGVQNAMLAVVRIVHAAAMKVYELFSYLNPFARHSPSLVENVTAGAAVVGKQYARMGNGVRTVMQKAAADLARFKAAAGNLGIDEWSDKRLEIAEGLPQMLPLFNALVGDLKQLNGVLSTQERAVRAQEGVVARWKSSLDAANASVDSHQNKLDGLRNTLQELQDAYSGHEQAMQSYAAAPIKGMGEMSDKIFENEMAQKKLRLEIMDWEDANGSIEEHRDRLALLQGDIENARGEAAELRSAGAGSDILGPIEAEIAAMEQQAKAAQKAMDDSPVNKMQKELEALERQGTRLDLENSIKFDPMIREIDKLANAQKELTYEEIVAGIKREQAAMAELQPKIDAATKAVEAQEAAVKSATEARDAIQATYDAESAKLDTLKESYQATEQMIRDIESALNDVGSAAREANEAQAKLAREKKGADPSYALEKFDSAAAADFADVGGSGNVPREFPEIGDQSAMIDEMTRQLEKETSKLFAGGGMLDGLKKMWGKVEEWWATSAWPKLEPVFDTVGGWIKTGYGKMFDGKGFEITPIWDKIVEKSKQGGEKLKGGFQFVGDIVMAVWRLLGDDIVDVFTEAWDSIQKAFGDIGREVEKYGDLWEPIKKAAGILWDFIKGVFVVGFGLLTLIWSTGWTVLSEVIGPIIDTISDLIENALQIIRGIIQVVLAAINGDWKLALEGIWNIVSGGLDLIWDLFKGFGRIIWGVVKGIVEGIFEFFVWLWDELVGHSIVPDIVDGIVDVFETLASLPKWIWNNVLKPIFDFFVQVGQWIWDKVKWIAGKVKEAWDVLKSLGTWTKTNVLDPITKVFTDGGQWLWDKAKWIKTKIGEGLDGLKALGGWVKTNVVNPIQQKFTDAGQWLWDKAKWIKTKIGEGFDGLKALGGWIKTNVIDPINSKFVWLWDNALKPLMNRMLRGFANIWNAVGEGISRGVNVGIGAVNKLIDALNWIGSKVPGLDFSIGAVGTVTWSKWTPPQFATGGVLPSNVGEGFATNQARAIVGEGNTTRPEYVIPTDPRHRRNALRLYGDLGAKLGAQPIGGWGFDIPNIDIAKAVGAAGNKVRRGAVKTAFAGPGAAFDKILKSMPDKPDPLKRMLAQAKKNAYDWAMGIDQKIPDVPPPGAMGNEPVSGTGWGAIEGWLKANGNVARAITSTLRPGDSGHHGRGMAIDYSIGGHGNRGYNHPGLRAIFDALLPIGGNLRELILAGAPFNIKNGRQVPGYAWGSPGAPGNHWNHVHAAIGSTLPTRPGGVQEFAKGGIVHSAMQGIVGEAGPEIITPLAPLWARLDRIESQTAQQSNSRGDTIININGNLEFPNISDGEDASDFIRNLEIMARR